MSKHPKDDYKPLIGPAYGVPSGAKPNADEQANRMGVGDRKRWHGRDEFTNERSTFPRRKRRKA